MTTTSPRTITISLEDDSVEYISTVLVPGDAVDFAAVCDDPWARQFAAPKSLRGVTLTVASVTQRGQRRVLSFTDGTTLTVVWNDGARECTYTASVKPAGKRSVVLKHNEVSQLRESTRRGLGVVKPDGVKLAALLRGLRKSDDRSTLFMVESMMATRPGASYRDVLRWIG